MAHGGTEGLTLSQVYCGGIDFPNGGEYGQDTPLTVSCGDVHNYLGMTLDFLNHISLVPEKSGSSHQRHNRQHNDEKVTSLGSLLGMQVKLSNGIVDKKQPSNLHRQVVSGHPNWMLGRYCIHGTDEQMLSTPEHIQLIQQGCPLALGIKPLWQALT